MILEKINLGEVVTIQGGGTPSRKKAAYWGGNIPWASVKDLGSFHLSSTQETITSLGVTNSSTRVVPPGTVIVGTRMSIGNPCINTVPIAINQDLKAITPSSRVHNRYLMWFLHYSEPHLESNATGATVKGIKLEHLHKLKIPLPPLPEQRRIAAILDQADAIRRKRREAIAMTEELLRSTFLEMFGDPVTNPKGWPKIQIKDLLKLRSGNFLPAKSMVPGPHPVFGGNGINGYHASYMFQDKMIVVGRVGVYCGVVHRTPPLSWVTDNAMYVAEQDDSLSDDYLEWALRLANLNQYASQAAQPLLSASRIYPIKLVVPPKSVQDQFSNAINVHAMLMKHSLSAEQESDNLFHALVQKAFQGKL